MKKTLLALLLLSSSCAHDPRDAALSDLIVCGGDEVFILSGAAPAKTWSWKAAEHPELPEPLRKKFGSTDDCKPVDGGRRILISSSGGAVALVERPGGKVLFHAAVVNAHSAEPLPGNRVVAASSTGEGGNRVLLYDLSKSDQPLASDELHGAHGAVWDADRQLLWMLGELELRSYKVENDALLRKGSWALPNPGGHDLRPVPESSALLITTGQHVWVFDRVALRFQLHPRMGDMAGVKCVDLDPATGAMVYVQAETKWWSENIRVLGSDRPIPLPGQKIYKARWLPAPD